MYKIIIASILLCLTTYASYAENSNTNPPIEEVIKHQVSEIQIKGIGLVKTGDLLESKKHGGIVSVKEIYSYKKTNLVYIGLYSKGTFAVLNSNFFKSVNKNEKTINTGPWLDFMRPAVVSPLCNEKNPLRYCYDIDRAECERTGLTASTNCINTMKTTLPKQLKNNGAKHWGGMLGVCTMKAYVLANRGRLYENKEQCKKWRKP